MRDANSVDAKYASRLKHNANSLVPDAMGVCFTAGFVARQTTCTNDSPSKQAPLCTNCYFAHNTQIWNVAGSGS